MSTKPPRLTKPAIRKTARANVAARLARKHRPKPHRVAPTAVEIGIKPQFNEPDAGPYLVLEVPIEQVKSRPDLIEVPIPPSVWARLAKWFCP